MIDRDGVIAHTEDTVELAESEGETGLLGGFGEVLLLNHDIADGHGVLRNEALKRAGPVSDGELGAVGLVRGRSGRVELGMQLGQ